MVDIIRKPLTSLQNRMISFAVSATIGLSPKTGLYLHEARFASGILFKKGKRCFIATVAHYFEQVPLKEMSATFAPRTLSYVDTREEVLRIMNEPGAERRATKAVPVPALWHKCGSELEDVAVIEVPPDWIPSGIWVPDVAEFPKMMKMPDLGELVLLTGLPVKDSFKKTIEPASGTTPEMAELGRMAEASYRQHFRIRDYKAWKDDNGKRRFFPSYQFVLPYPSDRKEAPLGLSGGGVWRTNEGKTRAGIIQPYPMPVGIEHSYHKTWECVKVTSIKRVLPLLKGPMSCARCAARTRKSPRQIPANPTPADRI